MQKYSAYNRKIQKYSAHKAKNAVHTRKMQHMRLENSSSKSEPDVGSSAGVGCGVDSRCWLGRAAAGRPLGRSLARSLLWAGYPRRGTKKRSSARARPETNPAHHNNTPTQAFLARWLCALFPGLVAGCLAAAGGVVVVVKVWRSLLCEVRDYSGPCHRRARQRVVAAVRGGGGARGAAFHARTI